MSTAQFASMTGFGRGRATAEDVSFVVEAKSVNHKNLDVQLRLDRSVAAVEPALLALVRDRVPRGRVDLTVTVSDAGSASGLPVGALRQTVDELARAFAHHDQVTPSVQLGDLVAALGSFEPPPPPLTPAREAALLDAATAAVEELCAFRAREGTRVLEVIMAHHAAARDQVGRLRARTRLGPAEKRARLTERLAAVDVALPPERLAQEVALIADRVDVDEELDRLALHLDHFLAITEGDQPGRKLSFLCQELLREANTVASKVQDAAAAHLVVDLKVTIERLREQVQNIA